MSFSLIWTGKHGFPCILYNIHCIRAREVFGNPSPPPNFPSPKREISRVEGNPRDFPRPWVLHPETRGISRGRKCTIHICSHCICFSLLLYAGYWSSQKKLLAGVVSCIICNCFYGCFLYFFCLMCGPMAKTKGSLLAGGASYWIGLGAQYVWFLAIHILKFPRSVVFLWLILPVILYLW